MWACHKRQPTTLSTARHKCSDPPWRVWYKDSRPEGTLNTAWACQIRQPSILLHFMDLRRHAKRGSPQSCPLQELTASKPELLHEDSTCLRAACSGSGHPLYSSAGLGRPSNEISARRTSVVATVAVLTRVLAAALVLMRTAPSFLPRFEKGCTWASNQITGRT